MTRLSRTYFCIGYKKKRNTIGFLVSDTASTTHISVIAKKCITLVSYCNGIVWGDDHRKLYFVTAARNSRIHNTWNILEGMTSCLLMTTITHNISALKAWHFYTMHSVRFYELHFSHHYCTLHCTFKGKLSFVFSHFTFLLTFVKFTGN